MEPMVPLLRALLARGHEVAWAGAAESHARARAVGARTCFEVGPGMAEARAEYLRRWPQAEGAAGPAADPDAFARRFGALLAPAMLVHLVRAIEAWRPQLVVSELGVLAAPLACKLTACLQVTHGFGMPPQPHLIRQAGEAFAASWRAQTSAPPPPDAGVFGHLYLDIYPPGLQTGAPPPPVGTLALRPCTARPRDVTTLPSVLQPCSGDPRPLVYLTFGTVVNRCRALVTATLALACLPVRLLVTIGADGDATTFGSVPANVHVERFVEQSALMPHCDLVVSHGGSGTFLAALAHGLPQLVLPQGADQFVNAAALERRGAGLALRGGEAAGDAIKDCVQRLLLDGPHRTQARAIADEIATMPSADEVALRLERLCG